MGCCQDHPGRQGGLGYKWYRAQALHCACCRPEAARNSPLWAAAKITPAGKEVDAVVEPYQVFFTPPKAVSAAMQQDAHMLSGV